jgi:magnesium-transporting ATPase (P-type)
VALYAIALALAIIPESLTAVVAMTMAKGVTHMARHNAIVRSLDSMEALGGIGDICCDKTGTLTTGKMIVRKVWNGKGVWNCEGSLDDPEKFGDLIRCASLSNNAVVTRERDKWHAHGEAIEVLPFGFTLMTGRFATFCSEIRISEIICGGFVGRSPIAQVGSAIYTCTDIAVQFRHQKDDRCLSRFAYREE